MFKVFVVSGGRGKTGEEMARAAMVQFGNAPVELIVRGKVRKAAQVRQIVQEAADGKSMILHTLVADEARRVMFEEAHLRGVDAVDMLGPVVDHLGEHLKLTPLGKPGLLAHTEAAKSREIEAVEFAFRHDDGNNMQELDRAEVVLVGVSRSMKTPTTLYLAYRGWLAANVPLIPEIPVPAELVKLPRTGVFYLHTAPDRLKELRRSRAERDAIPLTPYASSKQIRDELQFAQRTCGKYGWRKIDVTGKSVEEVSREIIALASHKPRTRGGKRRR
jgi:regulator of PEP synthase PpsR (kinase-PPPase family)